MKNAIVLSSGAIATGTDVVLLWNTEKGSAGNKPITSTVDSAALKCPKKMDGGKDDGRDFTTKEWGYVRTFTYSDDATPKPLDGQTAKIKSRHDGWIEIEKVWVTSSEVDVTKTVASDYDYWGNANPKNGDKYVLCAGIQMWIDHDTQKETPAIITVEEVLEDAKFEAINTTYAWDKIDEVEQGLKNAGGRNNDVVLQLRVPCLFFGTLDSDGDLTKAVSFNPGPTNLQPVNNMLFVPKQFGPLNAAGEDIFEKSIEDALGQKPIFVDDWILYHRWQGEVHCGSNVKRKLPTYNWWEKLK